MPRKTKAERFGDLAGWKDARRNKLTGGWTSVYESAKQGFDGEDKYTVICEAHGAIVSVPRYKDALYIAGDATEFCDDCRALERIGAGNMRQLERTDDHAENAYRSRAEYPCAVCGRKVKHPAGMLHLIAGGDTVLHPDAEDLYEPDGGDLGLYPVGKDCARAWAGWLHPATDADGEG